MKTKAATLADVARHANVSYQRSPAFSTIPPTYRRKRVRKSNWAIAELKYVPNRVAQQLVGKESKTLGLFTEFAGATAPSNCRYGQEIRR
jgi:DNA-binding LacI/PurR family transcriptional regulator